MKITSGIKEKLGQIPLVHNLYNLYLTSLDLVYKPEDLTQEYYSTIKDLGDEELEHQIGRLTNFKEILKEIKTRKLEGDIIEFGTWHGFSMLWIAYLSERLGIFGKKILGFDSFKGLPESEGRFIMGAFKEATLKKCRRNLRKNKNLYPLTKKNIFVEQVEFGEKNKILNTITNLKCQPFVFIHIDCDVSSSLREVFKVLKGNGRYELLADECFILFDDYGHPTQFKSAVADIFEELNQYWKIKEHSQTKLTKNFRLVRK